MKISFQTLNFEIEKTYLKEMKSLDFNSLNKFSESITDFVIACGWSFEDYLNEWLKSEGLN